MQDQSTLCTSNRNAAPPIDFVIAQGFATVIERTAATLSPERASQLLPRVPELVSSIVEEIGDRRFAVDGHATAMSPDVERLLVRLMTRSFERRAVQA